jgi:hypothetical protein
VGIARRTLVEIDPKTRTQVGVGKAIEDFADAKVLIVLGDPGSGKSTLLRETSGGGAFRTASRVVNNATLPTVPRLFIDAVDEVAGDSADAWTKLINRLEDAGAPPVVISCRAQDWRGGAAISDFEQVYGTDTLKVALLQPLDRAGALAVLEGLVADPAAFIKEVDARDLRTFLQNPNDLTLLVDATKSGWPTTRKDLFAMATQTVLGEANDTHASRSAYRPEDLKAAAGWICASLLLSGEDETARNGACLPTPVNGPVRRTEVEAVLKTRAFAEVGGLVHPAHRTVAEFLAGQWLGESMATARDQARIQALLFAPDGSPPTSLRSLFAWTVNFMPSHRAESWLMADPVGLVLHGDVELLMNSQRAALLRILDNLAHNDPILGGIDSSGSRWRSLITPQTAAQVDSILRAPTSAPNFKIKLLSGLQESAEASPPALIASALALATSASETDNVRQAAVRAYSAAGGPAAPMLTLLHDLNSGADIDRSYLVRSAILATVPSLTAQMAAGTIATLVKSGSGVSGRIAFAFERLSTQERAKLLDLLLANAKVLNAKIQVGRRASEITTMVSRTVERLVRENWQFTDDQLIGLHRLKVLTISTGARGLQKRLVAIGANAHGAAWKLFQSDVLPGPAGELWNRFCRTFDMGGFLENNEGLWSHIVSHARTVSDPDRHHALIECVIVGAFNRRLPDPIFDELYDLVHAQSHLADLAARLTTGTLHPARMARRLKKKADEEQAEAEAILTESRTTIKAARASLRDWTNHGLLGWIADLYLGRFQLDGVGRVDAEDRYANLVVGLEEDLAADVASDLIEGLTSASPAIGADAPLLAAMDLAHARDPTMIEDPARVPDPLAARLITAYVRTVHDCRDPYTGAELGAKGWAGRLLATRATVAAAAVLPVFEAALRRAEQHVVGIWRVSHGEEFAPVRLDWALHLLAAVPNARPDILIDLMDVLLDSRSDPRVLPTVQSALAAKRLRGDTRLRWTAAGWLLDPKPHGPSLKSQLAKARRGVAWSAIHTLRRQEPRDAWRAMDEEQLADFLSWIGPRFPFVPTPSGAWSGDTNDWDASIRVMELMGQLAGCGTETARDSLVALQANPVFKTYAYALANAVQQAAQAVRERALDKRDLKTVAASLLGGPPATLPEAVATVAAELRDLEQFYRKAAGDGWRKFWNLADDSRKAEAVRIKGENECRNYLLADLNARLSAFTMRAEELTASEDRIDIVVYWNGVMFPIEVKLDDNRELWTAATGQLSERYANDYKAGDLGIYLVLWTDSGRGRAMPAPPKGATRPTTPAELEKLLIAQLSGADRERVTVVVLDMSKR